MKRYYFVAGEPSGDFICSRIIEEMVISSPETEVRGVYGPMSEKFALPSLFDISYISVGGFFEVIPKLFIIRRLIKKTVNDVFISGADVLVTIDSPGFCLRVAKMVRRRSRKIKIIHVVAPTVWAWRPKRALKMAGIYDHILTLFDFEPPYFEKFGLKATFIGHPAIEKFSLTHGNRNETVLLMPGSRIQEIRTLLPIFIEVVQKLGIENNCIIPTLPHLKKEVEKYSNGVKIETEVDIKKRLFCSSRMAIVASGTATLELALCRCPIVVCYKLSGITFKILKFFVKTDYISLVNIILQKNIVPELIQDKCEVKYISKSVCGLLNSKEEVDYQVRNFLFLFDKLKNSEGITPSEFAAKIIKSYNV